MASQMEVSLISFDSYVALSDTLAHHHTLQTCACHLLIRCAT
jgi:hypothetical protein